MAENTLQTTATATPTAADQITQLEQKVMQEIETFAEKIGHEFSPSQDGSTTGVGAHDGGPAGGAGQSESTDHSHDHAASDGSGAIGSVPANTGGTVTPASGVSEGDAGAAGQGTGGGIPEGSASGAAVPTGEGVAAGTGSTDSTPAVGAGEAATPATTPTPTPSTASTPAATGEAQGVSDAAATPAAQPEPAATGTVAAAPVTPAAPTTNSKTVENTDLKQKWDAATANAGQKSKTGKAPAASSIKPWMRGLEPWPSGRYKGQIKKVVQD